MQGSANHVVIGQHSGISSIVGIDSVTPDCFVAVKWTVARAGCGTRQDRDWLKLAASFLGFELFGRHKQERAHFLLQHCLIDRHVSCAEVAEDLQQDIIVSRL